MNHQGNPLELFAAENQGQISALGTAILLLIVRLTEDEPETRRQFIDDLNKISVTVPHDIKSQAARVALMGGYDRVIRNFTNNLNKSLDDLSRE